MDNGGLRYGAVGGALRPPLPTATQSALHDPTILLGLRRPKIGTRLTDPSRRNIIAPIRGSERWVAGIKLESRPASNRNRRPASFRNAWPASSESASPSRRCSIRRPSLRATVGSNARSPREPASRPGRSVRPRRAVENSGTGGVRIRPAHQRRLEALLHQSSSRATDGVVTSRYPPPPRFPSPSNLLPRPTCPLSQEDSRLRDQLRRSLARLDYRLELLAFLGAQFHHVLL